MLSVASVVGREFELRLLGRLMEGMSSDELLESVEEALAITQKLGMRPLMERVVALKEKVESQPGRAERPFASTYPDGLTQREMEVLRLIAAGKSNSEIAQELVISLNTVARHASNIFSKTDAANRAEATAYALRHGLVQ